MLTVDINAKIIVAGYSTEYFLLLNGREKPTQAKTVTDSALKALKTITDNVTLRNKWEFPGLGLAVSTPCFHCQGCCW